jgi:hypothetical protein
VLFRHQRIELRDDLRMLDRKVVLFCRIGG